MKAFPKDKKMYLPFGESNQVYKETNTFRNYILRY